MKKDIKNLFEEMYYAILRFYNNTTHSIKNLWKRYRMGVGCCDLFGYYDYIGRKIGKDLRLYHRHNASWPGDDEFPTFESWQDFIKQLSDDLDPPEINIEDNEKWIEQENEQELKQSEAMIRFAKHFRSFWI